MVGSYIDIDTGDDTDSGSPAHKGGATWGRVYSPLPAPPCMRTYSSSQRQYLIPAGNEENVMSQLEKYRLSHHEAISEVPGSSLNNTPLLTRVPSSGQACLVVPALDKHGRLVRHPLVEMSRRNGSLDLVINSHPKILYDPSELYSMAQELGK